MKIFVLYRLRDSVSLDDYRRWSVEEDQPTLRAFGEISGFHVHRGDRRSRINRQLLDRRDDRRRERRSLGGDHKVGCREGTPAGVRAFRRPRQSLHPPRRRDSRMTRNHNKHGDHVPAGTARSATGSPATTSPASSTAPRSTPRASRPPRSAGRPVVGICNPWSELVNCNLHFRALAAAVQAAASPRPAGSRSSSRRSRGRREPDEADHDALPEPDGDGRRGVDPRLSARRGRPARGLRQDRSRPQLMGAASAGVPAIMVTGGPCAPAYFRGTRARRRHRHLALHRRRARRPDDAATSTTSSRRPSSRPTATAARWAPPRRCPASPRRSG